MKTRPVRLTRSPRHRSRRAARAGVAAIATAFLVALAAPASAQSAETIEVNPAKVWTPTGIAVQAGERVQVTASGSVTFGGGRLTDLGPDGIPWGPRCTQIPRPGQPDYPWPAPESSCYSLIARVGASKPVEIGTGATFTAKNNGQLRLGVNDNYAGDNSGGFTAVVTLNPTGGPPSSSPGEPPPAGADTSDGGGSNAALFIAIGVVAVLALGLLLFFLRRRRDDEEDRPPVVVPEPEPVPVGAAAAAAAAVAAVPEPDPVPVVPAIPNAPPDPESIDVNIFEVEFVNGLQLRVGYNHFPDGTPVNWRVLQSRKPVAVGSFVTQGGGSTNHFETAPLGEKLEGRETHPDGADVQFDWSINGVPFRYSVRRDPNC